MTFGILEGILVLLGVSLLMTILTQKINIPTIIGFILSGVLLGPHAAKIFPQDLYIQHIAELGLVFLMFTLGLEFSWVKLINLRREVFLFGGLQVSLSIILIMLIGVFFIQMTWIESIIIGSIVAVSSTAIVLKQLRDQLELNTSYGQSTLGVLLFQDLAVIPILIFIASFDSSLSSDVINFYFFIQIIFNVLLKTAFAVVLIILIGRYLLKPLYSQLSYPGSSDVFSILSFFIALGAAWLTQQFGLSLTLGAFLAGLMLSETEHNQKIEAEIKPIRNVLMGLFFIAIGMQFNVTIVLDAWVWILMLMSALIFFKVILVFMLGLFFLGSKKEALKVGIALANGGEFGFAILILGARHQFISPDHAQVILGAILFSMILAPLMIRYQRKLLT